MHDNFSYICPECTRPQYTWSLLDEHRHWKCDKKLQHVYKQCGYRVSSQWSFEAHKRKCHIDGSTHYCSGCNTLFHSYEKRDQHEHRCPGGTSGKSPPTQHSGDFKYLQGSAPRTDQSTTAPPKRLHSTPEAGLRPSKRSRRKCPNCNEEFEDDHQAQERHDFECSFSNILEPYNKVVSPSDYGPSYPPQSGNPGRGFSPQPSVSTRPTTAPSSSVTTR